MKPLALLSLLCAALAAARGGEDAAKDLSMRARVTRLAPEVPVRILWRWGGEGLGGAVVRGELTALLPKTPKAPSSPLGGEGKAKTGEGAPEELTGPVAKDWIEVDGPTYRYLYLKKDAWSPSVPVSSLKARGKAFITFTLEGMKGERDLKGVEVEFEFSHKGKVIKDFRETGPEGATVGIVLPLYLLESGKTPESPEFLEELSGLLAYATRRTETLEALPWAKRPVPRRYGILTDCGGYGEGVYYGIRHTNKAIVELELKALRELGMTGLRGAAPFVFESIDNRVGIAADFARVREMHGMGYPVPAVRRPERGGKPTNVPEGAGCPYDPGVTARTAEGIQHALDVALKARVDEVWSLTVDEIGSVFDGAPEGKGHQSVCPRCIEGFRDYLKSQGLKPEDFGAKDWEPVRPNVYKPPADWPVQLPKEPWLAEPGWSLLTYWSRRFNCYASARLFAPLREAFEKANEAKRKGSAGQPLVYSFALRGNTFLMGGHSLDFFNFYRQADNAFVYETSNRDPRVWQWDSYLCDVGRVVNERMGKRFGIYVKPHRGAPIQRALAALSRGATMLFWYTYGPDYSKGDSFSQRPEALVLVSRAARIIGAAEDVLYGATWAVPAEVAIVRPRSSEFWSSDAAWENGKWVYAALQHAHIPVDPLDEEMLAADDLSRYRYIVVSGSHLRRGAAERLAEWVKAGGTLYTSGWGLARDEANQPLAALQAVLGLKSRTEPEMWCTVRRYGASGLGTFQGAKPAPDGAEVKGEGMFKASFKPLVGREALDPSPGTEVLARFADGTAAVTRNRFGKGQAWVVGFFPGLEYAAEVHRADFDMSRDFDPGKRSYVAAPIQTRPVVDAAQPLVEGILVRNKATGKRAVCLMNWAYKGRDLVPCENLAVTIRGAGPVSKVTAAWLEKQLPITESPDAITVTLPRLDEGEVLLID